MVKSSILKFLKLDALIENITGFVETRIDLLKVELREELAEGLGKSIVYVASAFFGSLFILFISAAVAFKIGESLGTFMGFTIVAGFYLLLAFIIFIFRKGFSHTIETALLEKFNKKQKEKLLKDTHKNNGHGII